MSGISSFFSPTIIVAVRAMQVPQREIRNPESGNIQNMPAELNMSVLRLKNCWLNGFLPGRVFVVAPITLGTLKERAVDVWGAFCKTFSSGKLGSTTSSRSTLCRASAWAIGSTWD